MGGGDDGWSETDPPTHHRVGAYLPVQKESRDICSLGTSSFMSVIIAGTRVLTAPPPPEQASADPFIHPYGQPHGAGAPAIPGYAAAARQRRTWGDA